VLQSLAAIAGLILSMQLARAAEPVRQLPIYVQPYYQSAASPGGVPQVSVNRQFDALLASTRREDVAAARDGIAAAPKLVTPMTLMVLAIRLYDLGYRDEAVFWFYVAKERAIVLSEVLDMRARGLAGADEAARNFSILAGPFINGYAFCDPARQRAQHAKAIAWVEQNPYQVMFMARLPALPGDRAANHRKAIANAKARAAKERAYFDDPKNAASFAAARKRSEADAKFCWK
jgi:hypothetical protein